MALPLASRQNANFPSDKTINEIFDRLEPKTKAPLLKQHIIEATKNALIETPTTIIASPIMKWDLSEKGLNPYYGVVSGNSYAMTGMPWLSSDARKAVMTEWFWQPIRGQPRRVDTNELRKYSNTIWVQSIVMTILNQISSIPWDIVPKEGKEYANVEEQIKLVKDFLNKPNKNDECLNDLIRAMLKDVLEIDAGVLVKVFTVDSYDFEHLEPRSGAPLLKPLNCPVCNAEGKGDPKEFREKAIRSLESIQKTENTLPNFYTENILKKDYFLSKPNYEPIKTKLREIVSYNSPNDANSIEIGEEPLKETGCPFCHGTGKGRQLVEIYARDGASFLKDSDRTGWCFLPQTKVQTNLGFENIEEITGLVLDHEGKFRKFVPLERQYSGDVLRIKIEGTPEIVCTPEHPFLINGNWIEAKNLKERDYVSITTPHYEDKYFEFEIDLHARTKSTSSLKRHKKTKQIEKYEAALKLNKGGTNGYQISKELGINHRTVYSWLNQKNKPFELKEKEKELNKLIRNLTVDETFARFLGFYVAEGYSMNDGTIGFCFHTKEKEYYNFIKDFSKKTFGKESRTQTHRIENEKMVYSARVDMQSVPLANWLKENFGSNAHNKKVPSWLYVSPESVRREFIKAYCQGDGNLEKKYLIIGTTVSEQLSLGIKSLCNSIGLKAIICESPERISNFSGRKVKTSKSYKISVAGKFKEIDGVFSLKKEMIYKIRKITKEKYEGIVYNLNVEETNTYNVFGIVVHNCYGYWQYSYSIPAHPMWFNRDEIVYFMQNQRSMSVYGYSAVQSSLEVIKSLEYSVKHNMSLFLDGAVPDGVVSVEDMGNEEMKRMKTAWENELKGQPHKVVFINKKTQFVPFAFNNRDMQFLEGQKEAWKQVIANFNMTPTDLGFTQDVNRSSATQQTELTRRKSIRPLIKKIETLLNDYVISELDADEVEFKYIIDDPVEERKAAELSEIYLRNGLKTINEIRIKTMGLQPVDWGDENPKEAMMNAMGGEGKRGQVTGRSSEVKEERPAELEAGRRDNTSKDYQAAFQAQVPFVTTIQNLSTPVPFALPKQGHVNTQEPYASIAGRCPGCGQPTIEILQAQNGGINEPWYHCIRCDRKWTKEEFATEIAAQEKLHGKQSIAPKVTAESTNMNSPNSDLLDIAQRVQDYTETQGYPKKELAELSLAKKKKIKKILTTTDKEKAVDEIFDLGIDQGTAIKIVKNCDLALKQIEKEKGGN
jgi:intein/homing endonuclease